MLGTSDLTGHKNTTFGSFCKDIDTQSILKAWQWLLSRPQFLCTKEVVTTHRQLEEGASLVQMGSFGVCLPLERKIGVNLHAVGLGNSFLNMTSKIQITKEK